MRKVPVQDCKIITIPEDNKSFIIFIGADIVFMNNYAYRHSGKITSIVPDGFYLNGGEFVQWDKIADIISVDTGNVLENLQIK